MNSFEGKDMALQFAELTTADISALVGIRGSVDGAEDVAKLNLEAEKYAKGVNEKAFLSKVGEEVTGYVEVKLEENELPSGAPDVKGIDGFAHLARIGVAEGFRGKGIGKSLLTMAEEWAMENGKSGMWLDYLATNESAEKLYKGAGYTVMAEFMDAEKRKLRRIATKSFKK